MIRAGVVTLRIVILAPGILMKRERRLAVIVTVIILAGALAGIFLAPRITPPTVLMPVSRRSPSVRYRRGQDTNGI